MRRVPVDSTAVRSIGYQAGERTLDVEYRDGDVYRYFEVAPEEVAALLAAESVGGFVNRVIKPGRRYRKL